MGREEGEREREGLWWVGWWMGAKSKMVVEK
jgi:hypothetical protein